MKKLMGIALAVAMIAALAACKSSDKSDKAVGSTSQTDGAKQARENGDPDWVNAGSFTSEELKNAPEEMRVWKGYVAEDGLFFVGDSNFGDRRTATSTAELNAKTQIARYVRQTLINYEKQNRERLGADSATKETFKEETGTAVANKVSGIRRVDRYLSADGMTYVLMFVSNANIQKAAKDTSMSDYERRLIDAVFPTAESVTTQSSVE